MFPSLGSGGYSAGKRNWGHGMTTSRDELLRPSLGDTDAMRAPYSVRTTFLTAFFGGPLAALAIIALNSVRLRRWLPDLPALGVVLVGFIGLVFALDRTDWGGSLRAYLYGMAGERALTYLFRVIALGFFGLGYALHRKEQRSADLVGMARPNGWIAGIACAIGALVVQVAFTQFSRAGL
jgi:hypothetical protein